MISLDDLVPKQTEDASVGPVLDVPSPFEAVVRIPGWTGYPEPEQDHPFLPFFEAIRGTYDAIELAYVGRTDGAKKRMREAVASPDVKEVEQAMNGIMNSYVAVPKTEWKKRLQAMKQYREGCAWIRAFVIGQIEAGDEGEAQ